MVGVGIVVLTQKTYARFQMEGLHWLITLACVIVSTMAISTAIGSIQGLKVIDQKTETVSTCAGILDGILGTDGSTLSQLAGQSMENWRKEKHRELVVTLIFAFCLSGLVNILLLVFLQRQGRKQDRERQRRGSKYGSTYSSKDNF